MSEYLQKIAKDTLDQCYPAVFGYAVTGFGVGLTRSLKQNKNWQKLNYPIIKDSILVGIFIYCVIRSFSTVITDRIWTSNGNSGSWRKNHDLKYLAISQVLHFVISKVAALGINCLMKQPITSRDLLLQEATHSLGAIFRR